MTDIRDLFLHPHVADDYSVEVMSPDLDGVIRFLCEEREFSPERVTSALMRAFDGS